MRIVVTAIVLGMVGSSYAAPKPERIVNLDRPGSMEAIEKENPEHYRKILEVIKTAEAQPCETLPKILKTLDVMDTKCRPYAILTSHPPKIHLTFTIGNVGYVTNAVQTKLGGKLIPAK